MDKILNDSKYTNVRPPKKESISLIAQRENKKRAREENLKQIFISLDGERETKQKQKREFWENDTRRLDGQHFCVKLKGSKKEEGNGYVDNRSFCIMCQVKKISYKCEQCQVFLCIQEQPGRNTCFRNFHTLQSLSKNVRT